MSSVPALKPPEDLKKEASRLNVLAREIIVTNQEQAEAAAYSLSQLKLLERRIMEFWDPIVRSADTAHKAAVKGRKEFLAPLADAQAIVSGKLLAYRKAVEEKLEAERRQAVTKATQEAKEKGEPVVIAPPPVEAPKIAGFVVRKLYRAVVFDLKALARHAVSNDLVDDLLQANQENLNELAESEKTNFEKLGLPGVRLEVLESAASRQVKGGE